MQPQRRMESPDTSIRRQPKGHLREAVVPSIAGPPCSCGHGKQAHDHYRRGTDCALCACGRFRRPLLARLGLVRG